MLTNGDGKDNLISSKMASICYMPETVDLDMIGDGKPPPTPMPAPETPSPSPLGQDYYDALDDDDDEENLEEPPEDADEEPEEESICTFDDYFEDTTPQCHPTSPVPGDSHLTERFKPKALDVYVSLPDARLPLFSGPAAW